MTTLTVNIDDKKAEKAVKAVLDALGLEYDVNQHPATTKHKSLNNSEKVIYDRLKKSAAEIKSFNEGKIKFQDANEFLNEL